MDSKVKPRSSSIARVILAIIPIALLLGGASLVLSGRQAGSSTLTELGRVPKTAMWIYASGAVLPGSSDILLFGVDPKAKQLSGKQPGCVAISLSKFGYEKLFATKSYPNTPFFIRDSITPDGKNLLFSYNRKSAPMGILSLADGRVMWKSKYWANTQDAWQPLSSDGSMFLALRSDTPKRELWLFDTRSGKPVRRVSKPISGNESLERYGFVSGTDRILYIHWSNAAGTSLWSLDTLGKTPKLLTRLQSGIVHISPDGKMLAFDQEPVTKPKNKQITPGFIGLLNNNGHSLRQLRTLVKDEDALFPRWSPDSRYLAVPILPHKRKIPFMKKSDTSYQVEVYDVTTSSLAGRVRVRKQDVYVLDWYPDSKSLACISENDKEYIVYKLQVKQ